MTASGWLHIGSCLYLALVVTLVLGVIENDEWRLIWRSTLRRWLKLIGALIAIGLVVQTCTFVAQKNRRDTKKELDGGKATGIHKGLEGRPRMSV